MTQLRLKNCRLGLLINFGVVRLKDGIVRIANGMPDPAPDISKGFSLAVLIFAFFAFFA